MNISKLRQVLLFSLFVAVVGALAFLKSPIYGNLSLIKQATNASNQTNQALLSLSNRYGTEKRDRQKQAILKEMLKEAETRKVRMLNLIRIDPIEAERSAMLDADRQKLPGEVQTLVEKRISSLKGRFTYLYEEEKPGTVGPMTSGSSPQQVFITEAGSVFYLNTPKQLNLPTNSQIRVSGISLGRALAVTTKPEVVAKAPTTNLPIGDIPKVKRKIAVIMFNFLDDRREILGPGELREKIFTGPDSTRAFYQEASFSKLVLAGANSVNGDFFGWYNIPYNNQDCQNYAFAWSQEALQQAVDHGDINPALYQSIVFLFPPHDCPWAGFATVGNPGDNVTQQQIWMSDYYPYVMAHELGHNLGAYHANLLRCSDTSVSPSPFDHRCLSFDAWDVLDVMGKAYKHFDAYNKAKFGWLVQANTQTVTSAGTYLMEPADKLSSTVQSLRIPIPVSDGGPSQQAYYYLEYRVPTVFDNFPSAAPAVNGVSIRYSMDYNRPSNTWLIDTNPNTTAIGDDDAPLGVGRTFTDSSNGITISTVSVDNKSARVEITYNPPCNRNMPGLTLSPVSQSTTTSGTTLTYNLTITNRTPANCGSANIGVSSQLPAGFIQQSNNLSVTLSPGQSTSKAISVTSPLGASTGSYIFSERATDLTNGTGPASIDGQYIISQPPTPTPSPTSSPTPTPPLPPTSTPSGDRPDISSMSPEFGPTRTTIKIFGSNFLPSNNTVHFGLINLTQVFSTEGGTALTIEVPQLNPADYLVSVSNANGTSGQVIFTITP